MYNKQQPLCNSQGEAAVMFFLIKHDCVVSLASEDTGVNQQMKHISNMRLITSHRESRHYLAAMALQHPTAGHLTEWVPLNVDVALRRVPACLHSSIQILFGQIAVKQCHCTQAKVG